MRSYRLTTDGSKANRTVDLYCAGNIDGRQISRHSADLVKRLARVPDEISVSVTPILAETDEEAIAKAWPHVVRAFPAAQRIGS